MSLDNTASEMITQVRDICDEDNTSDITDELVLRMLNRAQQELVRVLTRRYENHFMREEIYGSSSLVADSNGQLRVIQLNSQAYGFAVNSIEAKQGTSWFPVQQVPFIYTLGLDNSNDSSSIPLSYAMLGNDIHLYPIPSSSVQVRIRYQFRAPKIVKSQGRITAYDTSTGTVTLDSIGSSLSTSVDTLGAFVNIIDHLTGEIKATVQISGITTGTKTLQIKTSSLDRSKVFGYTTSTSLPSTISQDDYVCTADGTCVPLLSHDLTNFLVDIAGFYVKRKLGVVDQADFVERDAMFKAVQGMQFGREYTNKIVRTRTTSNFSFQPWFRGG